MRENSRGHRSLTTEEFVKRCETKGVDLPIDEYKNSTTPIRFKCSYGHVYSRPPKEHLRAKGCPICYHISKNGKTPLTEITSDNYYSMCLYGKIDCPLDPFEGVDTPIMHSCHVCHKIYLVSPRKHLREGYGCPYCNKYNIKGD